MVDGALAELLGVHIRGCVTLTARNSSARMPPTSPLTSPTRPALPCRGTASLGRHSARRHTRIVNRRHAGEVLLSKCPFWGV